MVVTKSHITNWTSASANNGEWLVSEQSEYQAIKVNATSIKS